MAALAGVPPEVIGRARAYLETLESSQGGHSPQAELALELPREPVAPAEDALRATLGDVDPDSLSPREALELLYKLKEVE